MLNEKIPLCVDLDGTLIPTDMFAESFAAMLSQKPWLLPVFFFWLLKGRAYAKRRLAESVRLNIESIPYFHEVVSYVEAERKKGRHTVLVTASEHSIAKKFFERFTVFDELIASDGVFNVRGKNKRKILDEKFGIKQYEYAGNSHVDIPVWASCKSIVVVSPSRAFIADKQKRFDVTWSYLADGCKFKDFIKLLRPHQWSKNLLVFIPLLLAHKIKDYLSIFDVSLSFFAFCLLASGVYILNDIIDLEFDRGHSTKKYRPFASGKLPLAFGFITSPLFIIVGFCISGFLDKNLMILFSVYFILTTAYSVKFKKIPIVDIIILALLYVLRVLVGGIAASVIVSHWLLIFSLFIFLSLASLKRFVEIYKLGEGEKTKGRGYTKEDSNLIGIAGVSLGLISVLIFVLYVVSPDVSVFYRNNIYLLLLAPLLLYWILRVWLYAFRGDVVEDPVVFAIKDKVSYFVGVLCILAVYLAV